jgi:hypothetical protein
MAAGRRAGDAERRTALLSPPSTTPRSSKFDVLNEVHQRLHDMKNLQRASAWPHVQGVAMAEKMVLDMIAACQPEDSASLVSATPRKWRLDEIVSHVLDDLFAQRGLRYPTSHSDMRLCLRSAELYLESYGYVNNSPDGGKAS